MTSPFEPFINDMLADIQKQRDEMIRLHREIPEISGTARSKRRQVSATVDARGEIVELKFHGTGYRSLAPAELAEIIVQTIRDARTEAHTKMRELIGETMPGGLDIADLLEGGELGWPDLLDPPKQLLDLLPPPPGPRPPAGMEHLPVLDPEPANGDDQRGA
jgi:hypothetical protein